MDAAVRQLWERDESELRILDIASETSQSPSVIYSHFRSRQGLIDSAYVALYEQITNDVIRDTATIVNEASRDTSALDALHAFYLDPQHATTIIKRRELRLRIRAACLTRASLRRKIAEIDAAFMTQLNDLCQKLMERGEIGDRLSTHQWSNFLEGCWLHYGPVTHAPHQQLTDDWFVLARTLADGSKQPPAGV